MTAASTQTAVESFPDPLEDDWIALVGCDLPCDVASSWVVMPGCGAVVSFVGTVRDHSEGRSPVTELTYEAYARGAIERMNLIACEARQRWRDLGRVVIWHRVGVLAVRDAAVVVAVSTPHRADAFDSARWVIDTVKTTVPLWKQERWADGQDWGGDAHRISDVPLVGSPLSARSLP